MKKRITRSTWVPALGAMFLITAIACFPARAQQPDPLPSWTEGPLKSAIIQFVRDVTTEGSGKFVPVEERIATFDNDGTLWCEQPTVQAVFVMDRIKKMAPDHPEWKTEEPFKSVLEGDEKSLMDALHHDKRNFLKLLFATHSGMTMSEFNDQVRKFFKKATHPKFGVPFTQTVYQPMLELLALLRANGFKTFICSGGGLDFMRVITEETYGIGPEQVIGSHARNKFEKVAEKWQIVKGDQDPFVNDQNGKPVGIDQKIGRIPIFAAGNVKSGGDVAMLAYSQTNQHPSFQLIVNHDDEKREYAYSEKDNASLNAVQENGWHLVSMKDDWKKIFPFEPGE